MVAIEEPSRDVRDVRSESADRRGGEIAAMRHQRPQRIDLAEAGCGADGRLPRVNRVVLKVQRARKVPMERLHVAGGERFAEFQN